MIVKLIAPGIIPGDYVTVNHMTGAPRRGDTVLIEVANGEGGHDEQLLTVKSVVWPVEIIPAISHHGSASIVEVVCDRADDVGDAGGEDWRPSHPVQTTFRGGGFMHGAPIPASLCATDRKPCDPICSECRINTTLERN